MADFLLDNHVAVDTRDPESWQPIHAAAYWGQVFIFFFMATLFMISGIGKIMMVSIFTKSGYPGCRVIGSINPSWKRGKSFLNFKVAIMRTSIVVIGELRQVYLDRIISKYLLLY